MSPATDIENVVSARAATILEKVKALPPYDQKAFAKMFYDWMSATAAGLTDEDRSNEPSVQWPDFAGRLKILFPNGPIPGDPQEFWDEMRRE